MQILYGRDLNGDEEIIVVGGSWLTAKGKEESGKRIIRTRAKGKAVVEHRTLAGLHRQYHRLPRQSRRCCRESGKAARLAMLAIEYRLDSV